MDTRIPPIVSARAWCHMVAARMLADHCEGGDFAASDRLLLEALNAAKASWEAKSEADKASEVGLVVAYLLDGVNPSSPAVDVPVHGADSHA